MYHNLYRNFTAILLQFFQAWGTATPPPQFFGCLRDVLGILGGIVVKCRRSFVDNNFLFFDMYHPIWCFGACA